MEDNYFMSSDLSILVHDGGISQFNQFYDRVKNKYKILTRPYVEIYEGEKFNHISKEKLIVELKKSVELFVMA